MKKIITSSFIILSLLSCEKEAENDPQTHGEFLQEHIFNGSTRWIITRMEADTEREINGQSTLLWSEHFTECRKDNVYQFGTLGEKIASIHLDESNSICSPEEPAFVSQGLVLDFSSDFKKATAFVKGDTMAKIFQLPYDHKVKNFDFNNSWEFEEVTPEKVVVKMLIPADQSAGMLDTAATVLVTFERQN